MNMEQLRTYMHENIIKDDKIMILTKEKKKVLMKEIKNFPGNSFYEKLYLFWFGSRPKCANPNCNNTTKFYSFNKGYGRTCSYSCAQKVPQTREKIKQTNIMKYGSISFTGTSGYKKSLLEKYGTDNNFSRPEIIEKITETFIERYGVSNPNKTKEVREKIDKTNTEKYGVAHPAAFGSEKHKQAIKEKYGDECYQRTKDFKIKLANSWKNKSIEDLKYIQTKTKSTMMKKYGVEHALQSQEIFQRVLSSSMRRYHIRKYVTKFEDTVRYQSSPELKIIQFLEQKNIRVKNGPSLKYVLNEKFFVYNVDFETEKYLIEIK